MENPLISVIVPVYNVEKYLPNCINSVLNQSYSNWELILVNDGSPDASAQICNEFAAKDSRIRILNKENGGVASARNSGFNLSKGIFVSFLDGDDYWHHDYLKTLLDLVQKNNADIAQCGHIRGAEVSFPNIEQKVNVQIFDKHSVFLKGFAKVTVCAKLYHRKVLEGLPIPEGRYFEDDLATWRWYYKANTIAVTSQKLYYYYANQQSTMAAHYSRPNLDFLEAYRERISFFHDKGEYDLEAQTRGHVCRAMVIGRGNPRLTTEQKKVVMETFSENWRIVKNSPVLPRSLKFIFFLFNLFPFIIGTFVYNINKG
ncbi:glycosyltransferase family 2 protein [Chryseobacterium sp.]|uniref:glycosyltransferase family 2 protein n=1 Tax=Chryseobacterium sp. TaxID=1871047 RepID=UPI0012AA4C78|nr:glycosyltransferase family 2 protein [Chryseobacterium sp.]QFG53738.1 glycosyltransferase family 2 protein [Chryseobacterium sp.]